MRIVDKSVHVSVFDFDKAKKGDVFDLHSIEMFDYKLNLMHHKSSLRSRGLDLKHVLKGKVNEISRIYYQVVSK